MSREKLPNKLGNHPLSPRIVVPLECPYEVQEPRKTETEGGEEMNERTLRRRIAVLLVTAFLSVMGGFATTAFVFDDDAAAAPRRGSGGSGTY
jgi:hypothetical protein